MSGRRGGVGTIPVRLPEPALREGDVRLRQLELRDVDVIMRACADPGIRRFTRIPPDYRPHDAWAFVTGAEARRLDGRGLEMVATDRADGTLCAVIGLAIDHHDAARAEIGYWTDPQHRGRGIAGAALRLLSRWALRDAGFARLDLVASVENIASLAVVARSGFVREGTARRAWPTPDGRDDVAVFSLLPGDLDAVRDGSADARACR